MLPLAAGKPRHLDMVVYPGLVYFVFQRVRRRAAHGRHAVGLDVGLRPYAGTRGRSYIPMVDCECMAVRDLFRLSRSSPRIEYPFEFEAFEGNAELLFFSCHGGPDPNYPFSIALHIGPDQMLDIHCIHGSRLYAKYVFISACLGGVMKEDWDGNPMGLYAGFWLRGTRVVVASIVPVPDEWMPMLSVLTLQAFLRDGLPLHSALAEGKRRLRSGDWYGDSTAHVGDGTEAVLRRHVFPGIKRHYLVPRLNQPTYIRESAAGRDVVKRLCGRYFVDEEQAESLANRYRNTVATDAVEPTGGRRKTEKRRRIRHMQCESVVNGQDTGLRKGEKFGSAGKRGDLDMKGARTSSGRGSAALRKAKVALACILAASLLGSVKAEAGELVNPMYGVPMAPGCGAMPCSAVCAVTGAPFIFPPVWMLVAGAPLVVTSPFVMPLWFQHMCIGQPWTSTP